MMTAGFYFFLYFKLSRLFVNNKLEIDLGGQHGNIFVNKSFTGMTVGELLS